MRGEQYDGIADVQGAVYNEELLSELSKGRTERLSAENSTKIANRFGVSVQYLISGREEDFDTKLKYALFNGTLGVTDEMFDEVKQYAEMVMLREEAKRRKAGEK